LFSVQRTKPSWDLPTRLFHWLLLAALIGSYLTAESIIGTMVWHGRFGLCIAGLLAFRLVWGFIGPPRARFGHFFPTPGRLLRFLRGQWSGTGHNPLGALSVLVILGWLMAQVATGLFSNDDFAYQGYLAGLVSSSESSALTGWHHRLFDLGLALMALHVAAILFYLLVRRIDLVSPMVRGGQAAARAVAEPTQPEPWSMLRCGIAVAIAGAVVFGLLSWSAAIERNKPPPVTHEVLF